MASRRMFSKDIVDSDNFYDLPFTSQLLYFHLGMHADVKGFVQPKKIVRTIGLKVEDIKPLIEKNFVIPFETGVVVITHWNLNNKPRADREAPSIYLKELETLTWTDGIYVLLPEYSGRTPPQGSIGEGSIGEGSIGEGSIETPPKKNKMIVESYEELAEQLGTNTQTIHAYEDRVNDYMASTGKRYKDMAATIRNWYRRDHKNEPKTFYRREIEEKEIVKQNLYNEIVALDTNKKLLN